jgi:acyl carrier protein
MFTPQACKDRMAHILKRPKEALTDEAPLLDLARESFMLVEMVIDLQETFGIRLVQEDLRSVRTVGDLIGMLASKPR